MEERNGLNIRGACAYVLGNAIFYWLFRKRNGVLFFFKVMSFVLEFGLRNIVRL